MIKIEWNFHESHKNIFSFQNFVWRRKKVFLKEKLDIILFTFWDSPWRLSRGSDERFKNRRSLFSRVGGGFGIFLCGDACWWYRSLWKILDRAARIAWNGRGGNSIKMQLFVVIKIKCNNFLTFTAQTGSRVSPTRNVTSQSSGIEAKNFISSASPDLFSKVDSDSSRDPGIGSVRYDPKSGMSTVEGREKLFKIQYCNLLHFTTLCLTSNDNFTFFSYRENVDGSLMTVD